MPDIQQCQRLGIYYHVSEATREGEPQKDAVLPCLLY